MLTYKKNNGSALIKQAEPAPCGCYSSVWLIIYLGRCLVSLYILPTYSPMIPMAKSCKPPKSHIEAIKDDQPKIVPPERFLIIV